jgi:hypothetical protein
MDAQGNYLTYSQNNTITVLNITNISKFVQISQFNMSNLIDDIRIRYPYLFIATNDVIIQYDLNLHVSISNISNKTIGWRMNVLSGSLIVMYKDYPNLYNNYSTLRYDFKASLN